MKIFYWKVEKPVLRADFRVGFMVACPVMGKVKSQVKCFDNELHLIKYPVHVK